jgi:hypothetical protein
VNVKSIIGKLVCLLTVLLFASVHLAEAQSPGNVHRIGLLIAASNVIAPFTDAFRGAKWETFEAVVMSIRSVEWRPQ